MAWGVGEAYRHCERVTWDQARNFAYGIRLLPPRKRAALSAVYAFARRVDDIGDGDLHGDLKLERLAAARAALADLGAHPDDPVLVALHDAAVRMPLPLGAFGELIDGCESDVQGTTYRTVDELLHYCRCVAGSIGRLSLAVFGSREPAMDAPLADALGVALQLTNILRDVREDRLGGRVYLPKEDLDQFGCTLDFDDLGRPTDPPDRFAALVRFQAQRAQSWYLVGMRLLPRLDWRSSACCAAMAGIYHRLLDQIVRSPRSVGAGRMSLGAAAKLQVAVGAVAQAAGREVAR